MQPTQPMQDEAQHRLTLGPILRLAWRTLPYLKGARRDIVRLLLIAFVLLIVAAPISLLIYDLGYNRMLLGKPLSSFEAKLLALPLADFVEVDALSVAARQAVRGRLMVFVLGSAALLAPIVIAALVFWVRVQQGVNQLLRVQMVQQVQAMSLRYHSGAPIGDAIYRAYQDSAQITALMAMLVRPLWPLTWMTIAFFALLAFHPRTALALLVMYLVGLAMSYVFGRRLRVSFRRARESNSALTSQIQETMAAIKVVKAFGTEAVEQQRFERASNEAFAMSYRARMQLAIYGLGSYAISALPAMAATAYMAVWAARGDSMTAAVAAFSGFAAWNMGAYSYAIDRVTSGSRNGNLLFKIWGELQNAAVGMDRAFAHVDLDPEVKEEKGARALAGIEHGIVFHDVSFGYDPARPVLHGVGLRAEAGQITALCGPTGSGKSTLVSLLLRLFDPDQGKIEIDGADIRGFSLQSLRDGVAIALQENLLFGTTVAENIRYARPSASDEDVREAARIACALEFIEALPQGFDTPLGERGSKLSTGQRQRLSIARAVIKNAPILILDEPTASLDAETELRVLENLGAWAKGRAVLLITHRLSTIRRADKIVYLRDGAVVESGKPSELMTLPNGAYRRFVEIERDAAHAAMSAV
jgi:ABC-type multidrug transport system fused ATPase/permease subunit